LRVVFLGTGNAFGAGGRHPASILLETEDCRIVLDCGPAALPALKQRQLDAHAVDVVLVSHHHGDHYAGVPFLLLDSCYPVPREGPLTVAGPPDTESKIRQLSLLLFPGMEERVAGLPLGWVHMQAHELYRFAKAEVRAFPVAHYPQGVAYGYRVRLGGKTIVYSGDTEWTEELARQSEGADLMICECSTLDQKIDYHLSHRELEIHRDRLRAARVMLVHAGEEVLSSASRLVFPLAHDGQELEL
jgi:ribonuclease BN (tRNA processing enzyme)